MAGWICGFRDFEFAHATVEPCLRRRCHTALPYKASGKLTQKTKAQARPNPQEMLKGKIEQRLLSERAVVHNHLRSRCDLRAALGGVEAEVSWGRGPRREAEAGGRHFHRDSSHLASTRESPRPHGPDPGTLCEALPPKNESGGISGCYFFP